MKICSKGCGYIVRAKTEEREQEILIAHERNCEKLQKANRKIYKKLLKIMEGKE